MKWFKNVSTKAKLIVSFSIFVFLLLLISYMSINSIVSIQESKRDIVENEAKTAIDLIELKAGINRNRALILGLVADTNKITSDNIKKEITFINESNDSLIKGLSEFMTKHTLMTPRYMQLTNLIREYYDIVDDEIKLINDGKYTEAVKLTESRGNKTYNEIVKVITSLHNDAESQMESSLADSMKEVDKLILEIAITAVISIAISLILIIILSNLIAKPLKELSDSSIKISKGELAIDFESTQRNDEVGVLSKSFEVMVVNLKKMASIADDISSGNLRVEVRPQSEKDVLGLAFEKMRNNLIAMLKDTSEAINVLATASNEISVTTTQLAAGATETAASINETTTTVEEVKQTSKHTTEKAKQVSESAKKTDMVSQEGEKSIYENIEGMNKISEQMQKITDTIIMLSEQSRTIGEIVTSVSDIAEQSNLLAVNASIEAAKAGDQGKGFAVVAQEIKNLAEQSKQATHQVKNILNDIQSSINNAVLSAEQGSKVVNLGIKKTEDAGEAIKELAVSIGESSNAALLILATSQQQSIGMDQVGSAMENIKLASLQNVESIKQLEVAARNLKDLGDKLIHQMDKYKI